MGRRYITRRNKWILNRFRELRGQDIPVKQAAAVISDELNGQIAPATVLSIIYRKG